MLASVFPVSQRFNYAAISSLRTYFSPCGFWSVEDREMETCDFNELTSACPLRRNPHQAEAQQEGGAWFGYRGYPGFVVAVGIRAASRSHREKSGAGMLVSGTRPSSKLRDTFNALGEYLSREDAAMMGEAEGARSS